MRRAGMGVRTCWGVVAITSLHLQQDAPHDELVAQAVELDSGTRHVHRRLELHPNLHLPLVQRLRKTRTRVNIPITITKRQPRDECGGQTEPSEV